MADYQKQLTFGEFYERKKHDYILNRMESRENELKTIKFYELTKKILKSPFAIIKKTDEFNTSMIDTPSEKFVAMATAFLYVSIFYIGYQFCSVIIDSFKTYIIFIYNMKNTSHIVGGLFITLFIAWFVTDRIIKKVINKLYKERSLRKLLKDKFNEEYDNKIANEDMIEAFVYYYHADIYKNALQKIYNLNGDKVYHKDLININAYL